MLSFADSVWHVFTSFLVFIAGLVFVHRQKTMFGVPRDLAVALYMVHTIFSMLYLNYSLNNLADSRSYYTNSLNQPISLGAGTELITSFTAVFSQLLSMSYGGLFLVYSLIGFVGVIALASAFGEVTAGARKNVRVVALIILFLPGLNFWSSAIGKDALTFMGAGLTCWAMLNLRRRYPALAIAVLVFLVARPHIAGILMASFGLTAVLFLRVGPIAKSMLAILFIPVAIFTVAFGLQYAGVTDPTSVAAIAQRVEMQQGYNMEGGSSVSISDMSVPARAFTYLFRPLLFDANGLLGLIVSFENLILLSILVAAVFAVLKRNRTSLSRFQIAFFLLFFCVALMVLANTTANLGIAIRQKWMFLPMILTVALAILGRPGTHVGAGRLHLNGISGPGGSRRPSGAVGR